MFSRWNYARIKVVEAALNEGRLDEAYERLCAPELKKNRRAQELLRTLAKALMARARLSAQAGRYHLALSDLDRLQNLGRADSDIHRPFHSP